MLQVSNFGETYYNKINSFENLKTSGGRATQNHYSGRELLTLGIDYHLKL